jgi:hypothetical protein
MRYGKATFTAIAAQALTGLILTATLAPARADVIVFSSPALTGSLDAVSYSFGSIQASTSLFNLTFYFKLPSGTLEMLSDVDAIVAVYKGAVPSKQNLIYEIDLTGVTESSNVYYTNGKEYTADILSLDFSGKTFRSYDSSAGGFDIVTTANDVKMYNLIENGLTVPESSTWAMMLLGFLGLAGATVRQRRSHDATE